MQDYPHTYTVTSLAESTGEVALSSPGLQNIATAPPAEFGGPGDLWSPETLFAGAVSDCYILSFRAVTSFKKFAWVSLECKTDAILDKDERLPKFTELHLQATLTLAKGSDLELAEKLLMRAKDICLVTNSMTAEKTLKINIVEAD
jgi:organic hydroperoxide reductase OsmC/OhrA